MTINLHFLYYNLHLKRICSLQLSAINVARLCLRFCLVKFADVIVLAMQYCDLIIFAIICGVHPCVYIPYSRATHVDSPRPSVFKLRSRSEHRWHKNGGATDAEENRGGTNEVKVKVGAPYT